MSKVKTDFRITTNHALGAVAVCVAGFLIYKGYKKAGETAAAVVEKVNPASPNNFINQGVESLGRKISGDSGWTLGGWIYDKLHPAESAQIVGTATAAGDRLIKANNHEGISE
jgi:hypothetical protein